MKIPLLLKCQSCAIETLCFVGLSQDDYLFNCNKCGQSKKYSLSDVSSSDRLLYFRSAYKEKTKKKVSDT